MSKYKICGIYKITNMINGKVYIGQAKDIEKRHKDHINMSFNQNLHQYNYVLYRAIRKHGLENFSFEFLIEVEEELLDLMEIYYIEQYNSYIYAENSNGYNMTRGGQSNRNGIVSKKQREKISKTLKGMHAGEDNPFYGKTHSEESKRRMSISQKERFKNKENHPMWGKSLSEEQKQKISESERGEKHYNFGKTLSEEQKAKISKTKKERKYRNGRSVRIICDNIVYDSIKSCSEAIGVRPARLSSWLKKNRIPKEYEHLNIRYLDETESITIKRRKVICDNVVYNSIYEFERENGICKETARQWLLDGRSIPEPYKSQGLRYLDEE